jgi:uncharacterized protein
MDMKSDKLLQHILDQSELAQDSIHSSTHWQSVEAFGLKIAPFTGADQELVRLFAILHDSRREHDGLDRNHGQRSAVFAESLNGKYFNLDATRLTTLLYAIRFHNQGLVSDDPTIGTCWDADRLDLPRAGIYPKWSKLSTEHGRTLASEIRDQEEPGYNSGYRKRHS